MFKKTAFMFAALFAVCAMAFPATAQQKPMMGASKATTFSGHLMPGSHLTIQSVPGGSTGGQYSQNPSVAMPPPAVQPVEDTLSPAVGGNQGRDLPISPKYSSGIKDNPNPPRHEGFLFDNDGPMLHAEG